ncbi:MAG: hypothetical protein ABEJ75_00790 [Candidatus Nanohaloarchaea archaeon]
MAEVDDALDAARAIVAGRAGPGLAHRRTGFSSPGLSRLRTVKCLKRSTAAADTWQMWRI